MVVLESLFQSLWGSYCLLAPEAEQIQRALAARGETPQNDHIALRTLGLPGLGIEELARAFVAAGYEPVQRYTFEDKKLDACYYAHPLPGAPKVFVSALRVDELAAENAAVLRQLASSVSAAAAADPGFVDSGRHWPLDFATYEQLRAESEYAAWFAAFGFRANHFTILFNSLHSFATLEALNDFLTGQGFELNAAGGIIKGSPAQLLEQSSTRAQPVAVELADGPRLIPGCYYEFARRYQDARGTLFDGFIPESANRIFESTDARAERALP